MTNAEIMHRKAIIKIHTSGRSEKEQAEAIANAAKIFVAKAMINKRRINNEKMDRSCAM